MPKGVEHEEAQHLGSEMLEIVQESLMPKGVEHPSESVQCVVTSPRAGIFDAERR